MSGSTILRGRQNIITLSFSSKTPRAHPQSNYKAHHPHLSPLAPPGARQPDPGPPTTPAASSVLGARNHGAHTCWLHNEPFAAQPFGCDENPSDGQRKRAIYGADRFDTIYCKARGCEFSWNFPSGRVTSNEYTYWTGEGWGCGGKWWLLMGLCAERS